MLRWAACFYSALYTAQREPLDQNPAALVDSPTPFKMAYQPGPPNPSDLPN